MVGHTYRLDVSAEAQTLSSITGIPNPVPLDSVRFEADYSVLMTIRLG